MSTTHTPPLSPPTPVAGPDALPPLPDDVRAFCDRHGLTAYVATTARMLRESFPPPGDISYRLFTDPESEEVVQWVVVTVRTAGPTTTLLQANERFYDSWIPATPAPIRDRITGTFNPA